MKSHENDGRSFECYICLRPCKNLGTLKLHFKATHAKSVEEDLVCKYCGRVFSSEKSFDIHIKVVRFFTELELINEY